MTRYFILGADLTAADLVKGQFVYNSHVLHVSHVWFCEPYVLHVQYLVSHVLYHDEHFDIVKFGTLLSLIYCCVWCQNVCIESRLRHFEFLKSHYPLQS